MPYNEIAPLEARDALGRYRVIDVREPAEFSGPLGRLECAELVPLSTIQDHLPKLADSGPLLLVCRSGKRSGNACQRLQERGIQDVTNLVGGMIAWQHAGLPVLYAEPANLAALVEQIVSWTTQVGPLSTEEALEIVRQRFQRQAVPCDSPTHTAVEELICFFAESLAAVDPPDLALCLASFRRSLAVL